MGGKHLKFKKTPKYPHHRSEGLTHRGQQRLTNLLKGPWKRTAVNRAGVTQDVDQSHIDVNGTNKKGTE